jgi:cholesterol transport system auxiliary component
MRRNAPLACALALVAALTAGCLPVSREHPQKHYYVLSAEREREARGRGAPGPVLQVGTFRAAPAASGRQFVYRLGEAAYQTDFYNELLAPPDRLVTEQVRAWLAASGLFSAVVAPGSHLEADYALEGVLSELHGDYRDVRAPAAVLRVELLLVRRPLAEPGVVLHASHRMVEPLGGTAPESLAAGWNRALRRLLEGLEGEVRDALASGEAQAGSSSQSG